MTRLPIVLAISIIFSVAPAISDYPEFVYPDVFNDPARDALLYGTFPEGFAWSSATSSYQIEGAWDADGKGENIWDTYTHEGGNVYNNETGDVACKSYEKYAKDVDAMNAIGLKYYRFSISWARILPDGTINNVNEAGIAHYNDVINELVQNGITPMVTLYHWDLPQALQDIGGWDTEDIIDIFNDYASLCFDRFGDRVKLWLTFNEPWVLSLLGYGNGTNAPGIKDPAVTVYRVSHNIIKSHAKVYHTYNDTYRSTQNGQIGITLNSNHVAPLNKSKPSDVEAADRNLQFNLGWHAHPIFINGDYPEVMKVKIGRKSAAQGYNQSRLPVFTEDEKARIKGTSDFFGLNHYTTNYAVDGGENLNCTPSYWTDSDVIQSQDPTWPSTGSVWQKVCPWGIRNLLKWIHDEYKKPIYVTENGVSTVGVQLNDVSRQKFLLAYINEVLKAVNIDGSDVRGYTVWSLMDNFEWASGYTVQLGLHYIDRSDPDLTRQARQSAITYSEIVAQNGFKSIKFVYPDVFNDPVRDALLYGTFPEGFAWSSATSSYQIEGAWDAEGKGVNIWDTYTHEGGNVYNNDTGDVACNSYEKYAEDVAAMTAMGLKYYRFSISWARILPDGTINNVNEAGIAYYNNVINELVQNGITPMVTLYHWDLPQALQDIGGWDTEDIIDHFNDYANLCFQRFGDRVKFWITFNEPWIVSLLGYGEGTNAPGIKDMASTVYRVSHNLIKSHAKAYHTYNDTYRRWQNGQIGITLNSNHAEPWNKSNPSDVEAADRNLQFNLGWYAHPIFINGDYPEVMKEKIGTKSAAQGYNESRLPVFTEDEKAQIKGTSDFFGLNHYTSNYAVDNGENLNSNPSYWEDSDVGTWQDAAWPSSGSSWLAVCPWGIRNLLKWIHNEYHMPIYVTENGVSTADVYELDDVSRQKFFRAYINEVLKAINIDGADVRGYTAWSLLDNFEWAAGYSERFGMHYIDFSDPDLTRQAKQSAVMYSEIVAQNGFVRENQVTTQPTEEPPVMTTSGSVAVRASLFCSVLALLLALF
ncbi:lactase/phlorizin hydrolase-like [Diadema antillarum]|uniref:lactase/phlorizin hydrolase-like n=1 Tax=Diadema antillarum TaxID=105358 RepID=UPI003A8608F6